MLSLLLALTIGAAAQGAGQAVPAPAPPTQAPVAPPTPGAPPSGYQIGPNDTLVIKVFDEPGLSGTFKVDPDGSITYPLIGRIEVGNKTVRDIEADLHKRLLGDYVKRPQVSVEVSEFRSRSVFILGEVRNPAKYSMEGEFTLLDALARAGSVTATASTTIMVLRPKDPNAIAPADPNSGQANEVLRIDLRDLQEGRLTANIMLQDGDTIYVNQAERFYISGYVRNPGSFVLAPNMTVEQAIATAGGLSDRGSRNGIKIRRVIKGKEVEIPAKRTDRVLPGDTVVIRQRFI